jgi:hypothetical protein
MSLFDELRGLNTKADVVARQILSKILGYLLTFLRLVTRIIVAIAMLVAKVAKFTFESRNKIIGILFFTAALVGLLTCVSTLTPLSEWLDAIKTWLVDSWLFLLIGTAIVVLSGWNYISPTLRTWLKKDAWRVTTWSLVGFGLIAVSLLGWLDNNDGAVNLWMGAIVISVVVMGLISIWLAPKKAYVAPSVYIEDNPKSEKSVVPYESQRKVITEAQYLINGGMPAVFAISGQWGVGKTFLLERVREGLSDKIIWVNFEPWRYASEEALIRGFYQDISTELTSQIPGLQFIVKPLAETVDKFVRRGDDTGIFGMITETIRKFSTPKEDPEIQIREVLEREGRRLIIVIDDVERSFSSERIFRTLQLAHFSKNIPNVQVIFLCEKSVLQKAKPAHFEANYLEKFVEKEIFIPNPRPAELREHFQNLANTIGENSFNEGDLSDDMLRAVGTPRGVLRLFNEYALFRVNIERNEE